MPVMQTMDDALRQQDLRQLNMALHILHDLQSKIDKAKSAGLDVTAIQMQRDDAYTLASSIKRVYFPDQQ